MGDVDCFTCCVSIFTKARMVLPCHRNHQSNVMTSLCMWAQSAVIIQAIGVFMQLYGYAGFSPEVTGQ
jgi:hypothetical protein